MEGAPFSTAYTAHTCSAHLGGQGAVHTGGPLPQRRRLLAALGGCKPWQQLQHKLRQVMLLALLLLWVRGSSAAGTAAPQPQHCRGLLHQRLQLAGAESLCQLRQHLGQRTRGLQPRQALPLQRKG